MTDLETEVVYQTAICIFYYTCAYVGGVISGHHTFSDGDKIVITLDMDAKTWSITKNEIVELSGAVTATQAKACVVLGANGQVTLA